MKRKLYDALMQWKRSTYRKPLVLEGARQVGKTWLMQEFGKNEYESYIYINCESEPLAATLFEQDFDIKRILLQIQSITHVQPLPGKTLIIFDEIQELRRGITSLKYFCENASEYHVMVAGSLLGIALHKGTSFPVGKVDRLTLYPLDFEEFLWAAGEQALSALFRKDPEMINALSSKFEGLLRQYYFVGGMPEAVNMYFSTGNLDVVRTVQANIIAAYKSDISKHAPKEESPRINMVLDSIPSQLVKENKKFIFNVIKKGARAKDFEIAIQWLIDCGVLYKVNRVNAVKLPLKFYEDLSAFKLFLLDCGLFGQLCDAPASQILIGNNIFSEYKGAFTELYVLQQMKVRSGMGIYYWSSPTADAELDFIVQDKDRILPIEVKAEVNLRSRSLQSFLSKNPDLHGIRLSMYPFKVQDRMTNIPLFALPLLWQERFSCKG